MLGVAVDGRGRVYACDDGNGEIARWDPVADETTTQPRRRGEGMDCRTSPRSAPTVRCT
jgi:hypothetical protein